VFLSPAVVLHSTTWKHRYPPITRTLAVLIWGVDADGNLLAPPEPVNEHA
jgi:hypothetical protein